MQNTLDHLVLGAWCRYHIRPFYASKGVFKGGGGIGPCPPPLRLVTVHFGNFVMLQRLACLMTSCLSPHCILRLPHLHIVYLLILVPCGRGSDVKYTSALWLTGCLQLLEILEISWNLKTLLEISWNLNGPPGNFCVMIENWWCGIVVYALKNAI